LSSQDNKAFEKKISLNDELSRLKSLEQLELEHDELSQYQEHLSRSNKEYLTSIEAVDFYDQLIPFLVRELEKKKIAIDNMRTEKKDASPIFTQVKGGPLRTMPQDIKDWLKKLEELGYGGPDFDKLKKQMFQRDASGRLVKNEGDLYAIIGDFAINALDKSKSDLDKMDMDKKKAKLSQISSVGFDEEPLQAIPPDIEEKLKRMESADIDLPKLGEFRKRLARKKPTGEIALSQKEMYLKMFDFFEQEVKRSKAKWIRDKKLEATIDTARTAQEQQAAASTPEKALKVFPQDIFEKVKKLEESRYVEAEKVNNLKTELLRRNSNGNLVNSYGDICKKLVDFYDLLFAERSKELEIMEQFKEKNELQQSGEILSIAGNGSKGELEKINEELSRRESLASEYFARSQRLEMDIKRLRDRKEKSLEEIKNKSNEKLISRLLVVLDDLERAINSTAEQGDASFTALLQGVEVIGRRLLSVLNREGLQKIVAEVGKEFDPKVHEAFERVVSGEHPEDTVLEVLRQGYFLGGKLLRPALVKVTKNP